MKKQDFATFQVSLKVLLRKGDNVLLLRGRNKGIDLPGGRIDVGEEQLEIRDIIDREVREEAGPYVRYRLGAPVFQYRLYLRRSKMFEFVTVYEARYFGGRIVLSYEHKSYQWVNIRRFRVSRKDIGNEEKFQAFSTYFASFQKRAAKQQIRSHEAPKQKRKNQTQTPHSQGAGRFS